MSILTAQIGMGKTSRLFRTMSRVSPLRKCLLAVCLCGLVLLTPKLLRWRKNQSDAFVELHQTSQFQVELFPNWTTRDPHDQVSTRRFYLYSAVVAIHQTPQDSSDVHFVAFQEGPRILELTCCLKLPSSEEVYTGRNASLHTSALKATPSLSSDELDAVAVIYYCRFPFTNQQLLDSQATLSPGSCPEESGQFIGVHQPEIKPGGLAICAKIAYGLSLDPNKVVEWFELQKILGVDRVQLFDLGNSDSMYRVFRHYQDKGLLDLLPYKLPGRLWGRTVMYRGENWLRYRGDMELVVWDCRLRLAGFDYVMGIDLDEVIVPRQFDTLKPFLLDQFARRPSAASLHFRPQFFIQQWPPVDPQAPLIVLRYLNSTYEQNCVFKYVYLPERTHQAATHVVLPYEGSTRMQFVPNTEAAIFHYRETCKDNWPFDCAVVKKKTDTSIWRFKDRLVPNVMSVREKLGLHLP